MVRQGMARENLFDERAPNVIDRYFADAHLLHVQLSIAQQAAALQDGRGQRIAIGDEFIDIDRLATPDALDQTEIRRREKPEIVRVLPIDPLEAARDHETN